MNILALINSILPIFGNVLDKTITDKDERNRLMAELQSQLLASNSDLNAAAADIIKAEANSKWALAAIWRPILMLVFVFIIFNNYVLATYVGLIWGVDIAAPIPLEMWDLLKIGVGGYIAGRSGEKMMNTFRGE